MLYLSCKKSPDSIPPAINEHYYTIGAGNSLYHFRTDEYFSEKNRLTYNGTYGNRDTWKVGSEILNGGSFSISTGDHIMIHVKRNSIDYYKNGSVVHTQNHTPTSSPPAQETRHFVRDNPVLLDIHKLVTFLLVGEELN